MSTKRRFTEQMLDRIRPPQAGRLEFGDTIILGLQLRVTERGTKTFSVIYKVPGEGGSQKPPLASSTPHATSQFMTRV